MEEQNDATKMGDQKDTIGTAIRLVKEKIRIAHTKCHTRTQEPRLVAVSKTKPSEIIRIAYAHGQRHFGENYVQELVEKANHLSELDIRWHFIGHLQRNKCNLLTSVLNLWAVETVDSDKLASQLNSSWKRRDCGHRLKVFVQVNTSAEDSKGGCSPSAVPELVRHIVSTCNELEFCGLMTIGREGHDCSVSGTNPDFECLVQCRSLISDQGIMKADEIELSMGMSADYEDAIVAGSTSVRVGSAIFGSR